MHESRRAASAIRLFCSVHSHLQVDKTISFEVEVDFDAGDEGVIRNRILKRVQEKHPGYEIDLKVRHFIDE